MLELIATNSPFIGNSVTHTHKHKMQLNRQVLAATFDLCLLICAVSRCSSESEHSGNDTFIVRHLDSNSSDISISDYNTESLTVEVWDNLEYSNPMIKFYLSILESRWAQWIQCVRTGDHLNNPCSDPASVQLYPNRPQSGKLSKNHQTISRKRESRMKDSNLHLYHSVHFVGIIVFF